MYSGSSIVLATIADDHIGCRKGAGRNRQVVAEGRPSRLLKYQARRVLLAC